MALSVETRTEADSILVVALIGSADLAGGDVLQRHMTLLSARRPARVVFDLSGLTFIASMCMGILVAFRRGCDKWNGTMALAAVTEPVGTALARARLNDIFTIVPSVPQAAAQMTAPHPS